MSQLDSILTQLKKSLSDKPQAAGVDAMQPASADAKAASLALKEFLSKSVIKSQTRNSDGLDDPHVLIERRNALSKFVGASLTNNGRAALTGTIGSDIKNINPDADSKPFTPDPTLCTGSQMKKPEELEKREAQAASATQASTTVSAATTSGSASAGAPAGAGNLGMPLGATSFGSPVSYQPPPPCPKCLAREKEEKNAVKQVDTAAGETQSSAKPAQKTGVAALFAAFGGDKNPQKTDSKAPESSKPADSPPKSASSPKQTIIWYKHIQGVESAMRIGDMHFADSLLCLLLETAKAVSAEENVVARLTSMEARILMDRKSYSQAQKLLEDTIRNLQGKNEKDIAAAYCWRALAQCFAYQKNADEAEKARQKAISIANEALGDKNPEAMLFTEPLSP